MSNSSFHQEYKKGYNVPEKEQGYFHILFLDITVKNKNLFFAPVVQKYTGKEWRAIKASIEKDGLKPTGHDEYSVLHDPSVPKEEPKKPGRKPVSDNSKPE